MRRSDYTHGQLAHFEREFERMEDARKAAEKKRQQGKTTLLALRMKGLM